MAKIQISLRVSESLAKEIEKFQRAQNIQNRSAFYEQAIENGLRVIKKNSPFK